jgi:hypothetical protein
MALISYTASFLARLVNWHGNLHSLKSWDSQLEPGNRGMKVAPKEPGVNTISGLGIPGSLVCMVYRPDRSMQCENQRLDQRRCSAKACFRSVCHLATHACKSVTKFLIRWLVKFTFTKKANGNKSAQNAFICMVNFALH